MKMFTALLITILTIAKEVLAVGASVEEATKQIRGSQTAKIYFISNEPIVDKEIIARVGIQCFMDQVYSPCVNEYLMQDGGLRYLEYLQDTFALVPGTWLNSWQKNTKPQFYDKFNDGVIFRTSTGNAHRLFQTTRFAYQNSTSLTPLLDRSNHILQTTTARENEFRSQYNNRDGCYHGMSLNLELNLFVLYCLLDSHRQK